MSDDADAPRDLARHRLRAHLEGLRRHGATGVALTPSARAALGRITRGGSPEPAAPAEARSRRLPVTTPTPTPAARPARPDDHRGPAGASPPAGAGDKAARLGAIRERAREDEGCRSLATLRDTFVFAVGHPDARLMLVGEAPGRDEERLGEPFVGKAGQLLDRILGAMNLAREQVYISNIVKWRPRVEGRADQGSANRKPTLEEMEVSKRFVLEEIAVVEPEVIVALGGTAATGLLGIEAPVSRMRHRFHDLDGVPVMVTYHPSYLLRNEQLSERRKVWEDMLLVMERLALPIEDRQRRFFLPRSAGRGG